MRESTSSFDLIVSFVESFTYENLLALYFVFLLLCSVNCLFSQYPNSQILEYLIAYVFFFVFLIQNYLRFTLEIGRFVPRFLDFNLTSEFLNDMNEE